jgi:hypothetical protein
LTETSPVGKDNVPAAAWSEGCLGWTLADQPDLHVIEERMAPGTTGGTSSRVPAGGQRA